MDYRKAVEHVSQAATLLGRWSVTKELGQELLVKSGGLFTDGRDELAQELRDLARKLELRARKLRADYESGKDRRRRCEALLLREEEDA